MTKTSKSNLFMNAYLQGMPRALTTSPRRPDADREVVGLEDLDAVLAMPQQAVAIGGTVISPDGALPGWVTVAGGVITAISATRPDDAAITLDTDGIVMPGMLDLHGHPEFNIFAPWEPPKTYVNRYAWRGSAPYKELIRDPQNQLIGTVPTGYQLRYAEIRALVGGVTAIQGASLKTQGSYESMVRNVDGVVFGEHKARAVIDLPSSLDSPRGGSAFKNVLDEIEAGQVTAFYVHLAEGKRDNERSQKEFDHLVQMGGLTAATIIIHGTALTRDQFQQAKDAGAKLVWSPQSNLRLYEETTRVADALDVGLPVALGADWLPSGSQSLLAEMKVAREELENQQHPIAAKDLVAMVTSGAADIAGLGGSLGRLEVGRPADLVVMASQDDDAYESICQSTPAAVELVMIGGDVVYGQDTSVTELVGDDAANRYEKTRAWGRKMLLDTSYTVRPADKAAPTLLAIRQSLTSVYRPVGPIWA
ncbi:amidohydrolase family protein [Mycobacterium sp. NBC_00419]|uniref:amidohydrolase family protein n=1 Tax=Mycobacterium sp. NBC_00419 TaxID=2975989 RepID=UPI002E221E73